MRTFFSLNPNPGGYKKKKHVVRLGVSYSTPCVTNKKEDAQAVAEASTSRFKRAKEPGVNIGTPPSRPEYTKMAP
jgi:hypothetical protein